jgi:hypothetical protein
VKNTSLPIATVSVGFKRPESEAELSRAISDSKLQRQELTRLYTGDWRELFQCEVCRSFWIETNYGRYGEFSYFYKIDLKHEDVNDALYIYPSYSDPHEKIYKKLNEEAIKKEKEERKQKYGIFLPLVQLSGRTFAIIAGSSFVAIVWSVLGALKVFEKIPDQIRKDEDFEYNDKTNLNKKF